MLKPISRLSLVAPHRLQRAGFTLVEILVALGVMMLLLVVILVPLRLSFDTFHIGSARSDVQQSTQATVRQIEDDLRRAIYVFPNVNLPGVTDRSPYNASPYSQNPYILSTDSSDRNTTTKGVCDLLSSGSASAYSNPTRIDFLLPKLDTTTGTVKNPIEPACFLVTYYARRLDMTKDFDVQDNQLVLYRAQYPYQNSDETDFLVGSALNANTKPSRYPASCPLLPLTSRTTITRGSLWLSHNYFGEADLEALCANDAPTGVVASHTLASPRGMALLSSAVAQALKANSSAFVTVPAPAVASNALLPDSSFICEDVSGDGKIDRVTINLALARYDGGQRNGEPTAQRARYSQTVDLPNIQ